MSDKDFYKEKLLSRIEYKNDCWIWKGSINDDGYGSIFIDKKCWRTHRASYVIFKGDIPKGMCVCHSCDNPACIFPDHLWLGSHIENMQDMVNKKRTLYGGQRPNNKIPSYLRAEILEKYLSGKRQTELAKEYNCHSTTIWNAIHKIMPEVTKGLKGEKHPRAKLTENNVNMIREQNLKGIKHREIAKQYNISIEMIKRIVKRLAWTHLP